MSPSNPPDWLIERLALGELDAASAEDVRNRLRARGIDPEAALAELARSNREILDRLRPERVGASIRAREERAVATAEGRSGVRLWGPPTLLAGAALGAVLLVFGGRLSLPGAEDATSTGSSGDVAGDSERETTRIKGLQPAALAIYRRVADGHERLRDGSAVARGDLLQLAYVTGGAGYGVIVSLDGAGNVTLHHPAARAGADAERAAPLESGGEIRLPSAYELDDAPRFERFFLVKAETAFSVAAVLDAARALAKRSDAAEASLPLPETFFQTAVLVRKAPPAAPPSERHR